jgi:uncharacterized repeat protein (TIGR03803 family)
VKSPEFLSVSLPRVAVLAALLLGKANFVSAQTESVLYSFQNNSTDGIAPSSGVIADQTGALYGVTTFGGNGNCPLGAYPGCGTVFKLTPPASGGSAWTEEVIYQFQGSPNDGSLPNGDLLLDNAGALYGVTHLGGSNNAGVIFKLTPSAFLGSAWTETVLYSFHNSNDGSPNAGLVFDQGFALYGSTSQGGNNRLGSVFKLTPPSRSGGTWSLSTIYGFQKGGDVQMPLNPLALDSAGTLYGIASAGGAHNEGGVFQLIPPLTKGAAWTENVLYSFQGLFDGSDGTGSPIINGSGTVYGVTGVAGPLGRGALFQLTKSSGGVWSGTTIYDFQGGTGGDVPSAGPIFGGNGALYGTTAYGGSAGNGVVYKLVPPAKQGQFWNEFVLHAFVAGSDGSEPAVPLLFLNNTLYGTTFKGGTGACTNYWQGCGTVFQITP